MRQQITKRTHFAWRKDRCNRRPPLTGPGAGLFNSALGAVPPPMSWRGSCLLAVDRRANTIYFVARKKSPPETVVRASAPETVPAGDGVGKLEIRTARRRRCSGSNAPETAHLKREKIWFVNPTPLVSRHFYFGRQQDADFRNLRKAAVSNRARPLGILRPYSGSPRRTKKSDAAVRGSHPPGVQSCLTTSGNAPTH